MNLHMSSSAHSFLKKFSCILHVAETWPELIRKTILPWTQTQGAAAWKSERRTIILTPASSWIHAIKNAMAQHGAEALGLSFWTLQDLRSYLIPILQVGSQPADSAFLELLIASAASKLAEQEPHAVFDAIARDPSSFYPTYAIWNEHPPLRPSLDLTPGIKKLIDAIDRLRQELQIQLPWESDATLREVALVHPPAFESILITGFGPENASLINLLATAIQVSASSALCLIENNNALPIETAWLTFWKTRIDQTKAAVNLTNTIPQQDAHIVQRNSDPKEMRSNTWIAAPSIQQEADAVVLTALSFLQASDISKIAILAPPDGILAREIAWRLDRIQISYWDGISRSTHDSDDEIWRLWLAWQREGNATRWLDWIQADPRQQSRIPLSLSSLRRAFENALGETMVDDWEVVRAFLSALPNYHTLNQHLEHYNLLPQHASLGQFLDESEALIRKIEWHEKAKSIHQFRFTHAHWLSLECTRNSFLGWLRQAMTENTRERSVYGSDFFSPLRILPLTEGDCEEWSHLIVCGLNQGSWPGCPSHRPWIHEKKFEAILHILRMHEARASSSPGFTPTSLVFNHDELAELTERRIERWIQTTPYLAFTWSTQDETNPSRRMLPCDFVLKMLEEQNGTPADSDLLNQLTKKTAAWLKTADWPRDLESTFIDPARTIFAYQERRQRNRPFGSYHFALTSPPERQPVLAARKFATLYQHPELVWIETFLDTRFTEPIHLFKLRKKMFGTWIHRWLHDGLNPEQKKEWIPLKKKADAHAGTEAAAYVTKEMVQSALQQSDRRLTDWWFVDWIQAKNCAHALLDRIFEIDGFNWIRAEWRLPNPTRLQIQPNASLLLAGQIDLALARLPGNEPDRAQGEAWIIDYKTGKDQINPRCLDEGGGAGLQLALYGLALLESGAESLRMGLAKIDTPLKAELTEEIRLSHAEFWQLLARIQATGVFGQKKRSDYDIVDPLPLATLPIEDEILRRKWELTFGKNV